MPRTRRGAAPRRPLARPLLTAALLVGALLPAGPAAAAPAGPRPAFGAVTPDLAALGALERAVGQPVASYTFYCAWQTTPDFPAALAAQVHRRGALPVLTWEPWDTTAGVDQPRYALRQIAGGAFDGYVSRWAREVRASGLPLAIRFGHEMNGSWYPWAAGVNGNSAADYVAAYRRVHDLFDAAGATRVTWVWNPNVTGGGAPSLAPLYPGDAYVDQVGLDGYNGGTALPWGGWVSPQQVFGSSLRAVGAVSPRPVVLGEVASAEQGGSKAAWTTSLFRLLAAHPEVVSFTWFDLDKETDWRVESSAGSVQSFRAGLAARR